MQMDQARRDDQVGTQPSADGEFRALFDGHLGYVAHSLRRLGVREGDLADMAQEVFIVVYRKFGDYDRARPFRPWLFGIAFRVAADYGRLARHKREVRLDVDLAADPTEPHADLVTRDLVIRALQELDEDRRAVVILHDIEGYAMDDVATALGVPVGTGYTRLRAGRKDFIAAIERVQAMGVAR